MTVAGVAILVDGENISRLHAPRILATATALGAVRAARVYGHVPQINGWAAAPGFVAVHTARAKDGADLVLAIEAVALSHAPGVTHLVIATADGGLAPLLHHLRAAGRAVTLMGDARAPEALRLAATQVVMLGQGVPDLPVAKPLPLATPAAKPVPAPPNGIDQTIRGLLLMDPARERAMSLGELGHRLRQSGYRVKDLGASKWSTYLERRSDLCKLEGTGPGIRVHLL